VSFPSPQPIEGVIFDLHSTLADQGDPATWLAHAEQRAGVSAPDPESLTASLNKIVEHARLEDPDHHRDISAAAHREIFTRLLADFTEEPLTTALYDTITASWVLYEDSLPVLRALREQGIRTAILSNIAVDLDSLLAQLGLTDEVDAAITSSDIGVVKPNPEAFLHALDALQLDPHTVLMVGDNAIDDGSAANLGIRTLVLPRTSGPIHGLAVVLGVVAAAQTLSASAEN
jgi:2-haloalkanoic acid dehalogenase type II